MLIDVLTLCCLRNIIFIAINAINAWCWRADCEVLIHDDAIDILIATDIASMLRLSKNTANISFFPTDEL